MTKAITTYEIVLHSAGKNVVLPMKSERKTRSVLIKAAFASRELIVANISEADLDCDTAYKDGALYFGSAFVFYRVAA